MNKSIDIKILVATMTGTAIVCAEEIEDFCSKNSIFATIEELDHTDIGTVIYSKSPLLICSSTYGQGDVPDPSQEFYKKLKDSSPDLSHVKFALFGLGDMTYRDTFAYGGKKFDDLFISLNAKRLGEPFYHDASDGTLPEDEAVEWFKNKIYNLLIK